MQDVVLKILDEEKDIDEELFEKLQRWAVTLDPKEGGDNNE
jgi:copper homeostasis protein CutC